MVLYLIVQIAHPPVYESQRPRTHVHGVNVGAAARSAIGIIDLSAMVMQWGQCLEARDDDEMPEVLLGCLYIVKNAPELAVVWQNWGGEGRTRNQTLGCMRKRQQRRAAKRRGSPSKSLKMEAGDDSDDD